MQSTTTMILFATLATIVLSAKLLKPGDSENDIEIVGPCVNLKCPDSYACNNINQCTRPRPKIRPNSEPIGPCVNLMCPSKHVCKHTDDKCYPIL
ncbi:hypothetical protein WR25_06209 [Diploscapter pachys]|uniref:CC domain-containing protein n=1 Tax=Diploscapter pachys TaxID=2018661 RepID=A0A2A2KA54_9BILA|nr:hypothetical protein WR25_23032 [Diploscapter pachys]PAV81028.1 hypothetical protein WR25_06209 [Diploscapter pachys]